MAGDTILNITGNLTQDPELKYLSSGAAVAAFTVASTPRVFDKASGEWKDQDALFMRCSAWRDLAENVANSLTRGMRVVVSGRLRQRSFETSAGEKRTVVELEVDEVGPSLRYATAKVSKVSRNGGGGQAAPAKASTFRQSGGAADDPWSPSGGEDPAPF